MVIAAAVTSSTASGNGQQVGGGGQARLGEPTVGQRRAARRLAGRPAARRRPAPDGDHGPGYLDARRGGQRRAHLVGAAAQQDVGEVEAARRDPHRHLAGPGTRPVDVDQLEDVGGFAVRDVAPCSHRRSTVRCPTMAKSLEEGPRSGSRRAASPERARRPARPASRPPGRSGGSGPTRSPTTTWRTILWHATRAPTGSNRQPARFLVLRDGPRAAEAKAAARPGVPRRVGEEGGVEGYGEGSGADPSSPKARQARAMAHFVDHFEEIPVVVLACIVPHRPPDLTLGGSVYPACQNLLLAARALGYGGVLTMWHGMVEGELRSILLGIPDEVRAGGHDPARPPRGQPRPGASPPGRPTSCSTTRGTAGAVGRRPARHPLRRRPAPRLAPLS